MSGFLEGTLSDELIQNYRDDLDFQNLIDLVQKDFECCGISNEGYRDWSKNPYFNCTEKPEDNRSVERCGVPFSCCLQNVQTELNNDGLVNIMCGFGVQELKQREDVVKKVHTKGCIYKLQQYFEKNLFTVGIVALCVAVTQLGGKLALLSFIQKKLGSIMETSRLQSPMIHTYMHYALSLRSMSAC